MRWTHYNAKEIRRNEERSRRIKEHHCLRLKRRRTHTPGKRWVRFKVKRRGREDEEIEVREDTLNE